jgi:hypothetical protein
MFDLMLWFRRVSSIIRPTGWADYESDHLVDRTVTATSAGTVFALF